MATEIWRRDGALATYAAHRGVVTISYTGPATVADWHAIADVADGLAGNDAVVLVCDFRGAVGWLSDDELMPDQPLRTALTRRSLPGAMLVRPAMRDACERYAWALAQNGIERVVFTCSEKATAWAQPLAHDRMVRRRLVYVPARVRGHGQLPEQPRRPAGDRPSRQSRM